MSKKKIVAPFLKPIAILSISTGISATTVVLDSNNYKSPKSEKIEQTVPSSNKNEKTKTTSEEAPTDKKQDLNNKKQPTTQSSEPITKDTEQVDQRDNNNNNDNNNNGNIDDGKTVSSSTPIEDPNKEQPTNSSNPEPQTPPNENDKGGNK